MAKIEAYLFFDGNCADAMRFYERALGGKLEPMKTHADSPMAAEVTPELRDLIMHARLVVNGAVLMASDAMPGDPVGRTKAFSVALTYQNVDEAKRAFDALSEGGKVTMALDKTFWAEAFGMLTDRFGTPWMVSCERAGSA